MNKQALLVDFLEWMNEVTQQHPMVLETDNDDIAMMYLGTDRPLFNLSPVSTRAFNDLCEIKFEQKTDKYHFYYAGKDHFSSKSKFDCRIAQKQLQKELSA